MEGGVHEKETPPSTCAGEDVLLASSGRFGSGWRTRGCTGADMFPRALLYGGVHRKRRRGKRASGLRNLARALTFSSVVRLAYAGMGCEHSAELTELGSPTAMATVTLSGWFDGVPLANQSCPGGEDKQDSLGRRVFRSSAKCSWVYDVTLDSGSNSLIVLVQESLRDGSLRIRSPHRLGPELPYGGVIFEIITEGIEELEALFLDFPADYHYLESLAVYPNESSGETKGEDLLRGHQVVHSLGSKDVGIVLEGFNVGIPIESGGWSTAQEKGSGEGHVLIHLVGCELDAALLASQSIGVATGCGNGEPSCSRNLYGCLEAHSDAHGCKMDTPELNKGTQGGQGGRPLARALEGENKPENELRDDDSDETQALGDTGQGVDGGGDDMVGECNEFLNFVSFSGGSLFVQMQEGDNTADPGSADVDTPSKPSGCLRGTVSLVLSAVSSGGVREALFGLWDDAPADMGISANVIQPDDGSVSVSQMRVAKTGASKGGGLDGAEEYDVGIHFSGESRRVQVDLEGCGLHVGSFVGRPAAFDLAGPELLDMYIQCHKELSHLSHKSSLSPDGFTTIPAAPPPVRRLNRPLDPEWLIPSDQSRSHPTSPGHISGRVKVKGLEGGRFDDKEIELVKVGLRVAFGVASEVSVVVQSTSAEGHQGSSARRRHLRGGCSDALCEAEASFTLTFEQPSVSASVLSTGDRPSTSKSMQAATAINKFAVSNSEEAIAAYLGVDSSDISVYGVSFCERSLHSCPSEQATTSSTARTTQSESLVDQLRTPEPWEEFLKYALLPLSIMLTFLISCCVVGLCHHFLVDTDLDQSFHKDGSFHAHRPTRTQQGRHESSYSMGETGIRGGRGSRSAPQSAMSKEESFLGPGNLRRQDAKDARWWERSGAAGEKDIDSQEMDDRRKHWTSQFGRMYSGEEFQSENPFRPSDTSMSLTPDPLESKPSFRRNFSPKGKASRPKIQAGHSIGKESRVGNFETGSYSAGTSRDGSPARRGGGSIPPYSARPLSIPPRSAFSPGRGTAPRPWSWSGREEARDTQYKASFSDTSPGSTRTHSQSVGAPGLDSGVRARVWDEEEGISMGSAALPDPLSSQRSSQSGSQWGVGDVYEQLEDASLSTSSSDSGERDVRWEPEGQPATGRVKVGISASDNKGVAELEEGNEAQALEEYGGDHGGLHMRQETQFSTGGVSGEGMGIGGGGKEEQRVEARTRSTAEETGIFRPGTVREEGQQQPLPKRPVAETQSGGLATGGSGKSGSSGGGLARLRESVMDMLPWRRSRSSMQSSQEGDIVAVNNTRTPAPAGDETGNATATDGSTETDGATGDPDAHASAMPASRRAHAIARYSESRSLGSSFGDPATTSDSKLSYDLSDRSPWSSQSGQSHSDEMKGRSGSYEGATNVSYFSSSSPQGTRVVSPITALHGDNSPLLHLAGSKEEVRERDSDLALGVGVGGGGGGDGAVTAVATTTSSSMSTPSPPIRGGSPPAMSGARLPTRLASPQPLLSPTTPPDQSFFQPGGVSGEGLGSEVTGQEQQAGISILEELQPVLSPGTDSEKEESPLYQRGQGDEDVVAQGQDARRSFAEMGEVVSSTEKSTPLSLWMASEGGGRREAKGQRDKMQAVSKQEVSKSEEEEGVISSTSAKEDEEEKKGSRVRGPRVVPTPVEVEGLAGDTAAQGGDSPVRALGELDLMQVVGNFSDTESSGSPHSSERKGHSQELSQTETQGGGVGLLIHDPNDPIVDLREYSESEEELPDTPDGGLKGESLVS